MQVLGGQGYFQKLSYGSETSVMNLEGSGEMFESEFADMCTEKCPLVSMEGLACADPEAMTPSAKAEILK